MRKRIMQCFLAVPWMVFFSCIQSPDRYASQTDFIDWEGKNAQVESGGPFVGIETHLSEPLLRKISFYYPVANSIDQSPDYWFRERYPLMDMGLKMGDSPKERIGNRPFPFRLTPYSVVFQKSDSAKTVLVSYRFFKTNPAMETCFEITNRMDREVPFEFYTEYDWDIRTSHTYDHDNRVWTRWDEETASLFLQSADSTTQNTEFFLVNAGEKPVSFSTRGEALGKNPVSEKGWFFEDKPFADELIPSTSPEHAWLGFVYRKDLRPGQTLRVVQIIGSSRKGEGQQTVRSILSEYPEDIEQYEKFVRKKMSDQGRILIPDKDIDKTASWARGVLAANAHYIDGDVLPMPCPAEYNFFFTHDVLLTDMAAVLFDTERVKRDLLFLARHADSARTIPHAYYWKDSAYVTEWAGSDNWNHFWFLIISARYFRHSGDLETLRILYPLMVRSLNLVMERRGKDGLIWAYRPDWWDIGHVDGPRSYMTLLCVQALREFVSVQEAMGEKPDTLLETERSAERMQDRMVQILWSPRSGFLMNMIEKACPDTHLYMGSLLAAHFGLLDSSKTAAMIRTTKEKLLEDPIGIKNVAPMDFHRLGALYRFNGPEAGDSCVYLNGGIWAHANAFYLLSLLQGGMKTEALQFLKTAMTLDGIMGSPNGQPAMAEYRVADSGNPDRYGKIDKPQFLWAAGWTLYCIYHLAGVRESPWNLSFDPFLGDGWDDVSFPIMQGGKKLEVRIIGGGKDICRVLMDGREIHSLVVPDSVPGRGRIRIETGDAVLPLVAETNSNLVSSEFEDKNKTLTVRLRAFPGHRNTTHIVSPHRPRKVLINGKETAENWQVSFQENLFAIDVGFIHDLPSDRIDIMFE